MKQKKYDIWVKAKTIISFIYDVVKTILLFDIVDEVHE